MIDVEQAVILMGDENGYLSAIIPQLEELKMTVAVTSDPEEFQKLFEAQGPMALIAVDGHLVDEARGREMFTSIKQAKKETPVLWVSPKGTIAPNHLTTLPDAIVKPDDASPVDLKHIVQHLLVERFFPRILANAMKFSACEALRQSFKTSVKADNSYVRAETTALSEISSVISFNGPGTTGSVVVSGSDTFFTNTSNKILPSDRPQDPGEAAALAGEMCNTIVGKFKAFLVQNGMNVQISCPLTMRGDTTSLEYGTGKVSLVTRLTDETDSLFVELCLDMFDLSAIQPNVKQKIIEPGGLSFF